MVFILINKDVFEPSYNDLKLTVQNHNYICSSPITRRGIVKVDFRRGRVQRSAVRTGAPRSVLWNNRGSRCTPHVSVAHGLVCSAQDSSCGYDTSCIRELGLWKSEGGCIKVLATWKGKGEARRERATKKTTLETKVDSAIMVWWICGNCHAKPSQLYKQKNQTK